MKETRQEIEKSKALKLRKVRRGGKMCKNQEWAWIRSIDTITNTRWSDGSEAGRVITIRIQPKCLLDKIAFQLSLLWVTRRYLCDYWINWEICLQVRNFIWKHSLIVANQEIELYFDHRKMMKFFHWKFEH